MHWARERSPRTVRLMDMGRRRRTVLFLTAAGLALAAAGCSAEREPAAAPSVSAAPAATTPPAPPSTSPTGPSSAGTPTHGPTDGRPPPRIPAGGNRVSLERTGGFAGVNETLLVQPDGRWTYTGGRGGEGSGKPQSGQLTPAQRRQLQALVGSP